MINRLKIFIGNNLHTSDASRWLRLLKRNYSNEKNIDTKNETGEDWNILKTFSSKYNSFLELHRYGPFQVTSDRLRFWQKRTERDAQLLDQRYIKERHSMLGNDLATAHFIVYRGGRVKFIDNSEWTFKSKEDNDFQGLPKKFTEGWLLEAVDASGLPLRYEAFQNLTGLYELKTLILRNCPNIDDWCVDRISCEFQETLEHLDLSDCPLVTERALSAIYRFQNLKTLKLESIVKTKTFEYACLLLEDAMPHLSIEGVKYIDNLVAENNKT